MRPELDSMMVVRADLCERLESLRALSRRCSTRDYASKVESIRTLAAAYGLTPVVRVAEALERSLGEQGRGHAGLYLARLQDAIGCDRLDEEASQALLASVSVRLCA
jgi:hypothetical protein